jgi:hypothetical protein
VDDYKCPKCGRKALSVKYRERKGVEVHLRWVKEYRCPGGHKWKRPMLPPPPPSASTKSEAENLARLMKGLDL